MTDLITDLITDIKNDSKFFDTYVKCSGILVNDPSSIQQVPLYYFKLFFEKLTSQPQFNISYNNIKEFLEELNNKVSIPKLTDFEDYLKELSHEKIYDNFKITDFKTLKEQLLKLDRINEYVKIFLLLYIHKFKFNSGDFKYKLNNIQKKDTETTPNPLNSSNTGLMSSLLKLLSAKPAGPTTPTPAPPAPPAPLAALAFDMRLKDGESCSSKESSSSSFGSLIALDVIFLCKYL
jgi:hypothetical protein